VAFDLDRETPRIVINSAYRHKLGGGGRSSANDAPATKALLYFILREEFGRHRRSKASEENLARLNELLLSVSRE
jgi:hypothetical protein